MVTSLTTVGLEPTISGSVDRRLIRWAMQSDADVIRLSVQTIMYKTVRLIMATSITIQVLMVRVWLALITSLIIIYIIVAIMIYKYKYSIRRLISSRITITLYSDIYHYKAYDDDTRVSLFMAHVVKYPGVTSPRIDAGVAQW